MTAYERLTDALRDAGKQVNDRGSRAVAQCPAHDDGRPSLSVTAIDGQTLVYCFAGCHTEQVMQALGLTVADLFDDPKGKVYDYPDGRRVHRSPTKQFKQSGNTSGHALFRADRLNGAATVYVVEGEKDVAAVEAAGGVAVCSAMGAGKAAKFDWSPLAGRDVIVVRDLDKPGIRHAADIAELLGGKARSVTVVEPAAGKDFADHYAAGHGLNDLVVVERGEPRPKLWRAIDLRPAEQPRWLARGRIPRSAITLLVGDEGIGKSLLWVWVAAAITTGRALDDFGIPEREPSRVILVLTEDDWSTTVRPRLEVADADLNLIDVVCTEPDGSGAPVFPRDLDLIRAAAIKPALIVVDAWLDTVPVAMSVRDPQQARQALHPWKEVATVTDASVLLLTHTNRTASANPRDRYGATGELRKKARMTLYASVDEDGALLVGPEKTNIAGQIPASRFTIAAVQHFTPSVDSDGTVPRLAFVGDSERTVREHLAANVLGDDEPGGSPAKRFVYEFLMKEGGESRAADILKAGRAAGFSEQELKDARRRHRSPRIESRKASGLSEGWVWALAYEGGNPLEGGTEGGEGGEGGNTPSARHLHPTDEGGNQGGMSQNVPPSPPSEKLPPSADPGVKPPNQFDFVRGAGRCPDCGYHVPTQGHRNPCIQGGRPKRGTETAQ